MVFSRESYFPQAGLSLLERGRLTDMSWPASKSEQHGGHVQHPQLGPLPQSKAYAPSSGRHTNGLRRTKRSCFLLLVRRPLRLNTVWRPSLAGPAYTVASYGDTVPVPRCTANTHHQKSAWTATVSTRDSLDEWQVQPSTASGYRLHVLRSHLYDFLRGRVSHLQPTVFSKPSGINAIRLFTLPECKSLNTRGKSAILAIST